MRSVGASTSATVTGVVLAAHHLTCDLGERPLPSKGRFETGLLIGRAVAVAVAVIAATIPIRCPAQSGAARARARTGLRPAVGSGSYARAMTIQRMDNVGIVVEDLDAAVAFFTELGLELEGRMHIEAEWAARVVGLDGMHSEVAMMRVPDAPGRLELVTYHAPELVTPDPAPSPANTLGLHRVMFAVDDIEDTVARLRPHGGELVGEISRVDDAWLLCYLRGPSGIIVGLAEQLS